MTQLIDRIPPAYKAMLVIAAVFGIGMTAGSAVSLARDIPSRVAQLEAQQQATSAAIRYLACRALAEDEGRDPRSCRYVVSGVDDLLDGLRRR